MKKLILALSLLCLANHVYGEAGPAIPKPKISIQQAIELSQEYFYREWREIFSKADENIEDYIIKSIQWTNQFNDEYKEEWAWKIIFVHPINNSHKATYKIKNNGEVIAQEMTK